MTYLVSHIAQVIGAELEIRQDAGVDQLLIDSRKIVAPATSLFFALRSERRNGHQFIPELYKKGVWNFVISEQVDPMEFPNANFLYVDDTLTALQQLAAHHRSRFAIPVIGITGSNGKTIVKEWLYQLLHDDHSIVRSPKSYNSQIGVPLSVWQMNEQHQLALFEAGISEFGEMLRLERIIQPTIGVLTNIGEAHNEGFNDADHKFREKMVLFRNAKTVLARDADVEGRKDVIDMLGDGLQLLTWGATAGNDFVVSTMQKQDGNSTIRIVYGDETCIIDIPFVDDAAIENAITCACVMLLLKTDPTIIAERMARLHSVNMRLELKKGINHCAVINDSYSADLSSLIIALNFLDQQRSEKKTVVLSDFLQSGMEDDALYHFIKGLLVSHKVNRLIGIGDKITRTLLASEAGPDREPTMEFFSTTDDFIRQFRSSQFKEETILVKGARAFAFERIVQLLEQKAHQTVLEIDLNALAHNLKQYQRILKPSTKVMGMVKAFAYGSGGAEIAGILQYHNVDYLGVAYADEGVELRKAGINLPIMVMNPEESAFENIVSYNLEPELYSFELLRAFDQFIQQEGLEKYPVHIEIETGMNRLGFSTSDMEKLATALRSSNSFQVRSVFTHLAASEEAAQDAFTLRQYELFDKALLELRQRTGSDFIRHIANSAAAIRHPQLQMDMVRLGIGMYGIDSSGTGKVDLQPVATLRSTIAQVKEVKKGESVSYNRRGIVDRDSLIATVRIGYADGYPRRLGNGVGKVWVRDRLVPVIGTVCMDMFMVDITGIQGVREGDDVIIFGKTVPVQNIAEWAGTIPYEIMTGISQRVKRVYFEE